MNKSFIILEYLIKCVVRDNPGKASLGQMVKSAESQAKENGIYLNSLILDCFRITPTRTNPYNFPGWTFFVCV